MLGSFFLGHKGDNMLSLRQDVGRYTAQVHDITTGADLSDYIDRIDIKLPYAREISSMSARFETTEPVLASGNEIRIDVLDDVGNILYSLSGEARLNLKQYGYVADKFDWEVRDKNDSLEKKVIAKTETFYDLFICNQKDKANSLIHIIAKKLGFDVECTDNLNRIPFVIFKENDRWVDELQSVITATDSLLYIRDKKLFFKTQDFSYSTDLEFNQENIIRTVQEEIKENKKNGIKVLFDKFKRLEDQAVFNISSKIITQPNTTDEAKVPTMRIQYSTSSVAEPVVTNATGYYFTSSDPKSRVDIKLKDGVHYKATLKDTGAEAKFLNPFNYVLYVDNFEISGTPLAMYKDNESIVKNSNVYEASDEDFLLISKNKYIQTEQLAEETARRHYINEISSNTFYNFYIQFTPGIEVGKIYRLYIRDIDAPVRVLSYDISLQQGNFEMFIRAQKVDGEISVHTSNVDSLTPATQFIDLKPLKEKIEANAHNVEEVTQKVHSKLITSETEPTEDVHVYDVWHKKSTNEFKIWSNNHWHSVPEKDLLPAIKHYNSLEEAKLDIARVDNKAGLFLINDNTKFGSINGTLAEVSLDKEGQIVLKNVNNLLQWNVKDPGHPDKVRSKLYMGVTDVSAIPDNVYFKIGDDSNGFSLEFKDGEKGKAFIDGKDVSNTLTENSDAIVGVNQALQQGNFVVTGKTVFDGTASFLSKGQDERISIENGSINFYRTINGHEVPLTRIKNIKYGTIATDSKGKGVVKFEGFKQPLLVFTSIKSANFGKNMASVFCYAEYMHDTTYRFYLGGTNEDLREAKAIKVVGKEWTASSATSTTLINWTGYMSASLRVPIEREPVDDHSYGNLEELRNRQRSEVVSYPKFRVTILRNGSVLSSQDYVINMGTVSVGEFESTSNTGKDININFSKEINNFVKFQSRTNVKYQMKIDILQPKYTIRYFKLHSERRRAGGSDSGSGTYYWTTGYSGTFFTLTANHFRGLTITASAETSTISSTTGYGEVSYIAMEIN